MKLVWVWLVGLGLILLLYLAGNPFGIYDDILIIAGLAIYTIKGSLTGSFRK